MQAHHITLFLALLGTAASNECRKDGVQLIQFNGAPIAEELLSSPAECEEKCESSEECDAWTINTQDGLCALRRQDQVKETTSEGYVTGYKRCGTLSCRDGWAGPARGDLGGEMQGGAACVKVLTNNGQHYTDRATCRAKCKLDGGDLVSIHSGRENNLLSTLLSPGHPAWIGVAPCNNKKGCKKLSWLDGSPAPYARFGINELKMDHNNIVTFPYSVGSCYVMGDSSAGADPKKWVAAPCEGVTGYHCVCLEWLTRVHLDWY